MWSIKKLFSEQVRQNYESFFNAIDDFLFVLDKQGNIIYVNSTVINRLGYSEEELIGKSILMVHPPERRDEASAIVAEMLAGKAKFCPVPIIAKSGELIPVETRITHGSWNNTPVLFGVTKDVSQVKLSEEKFSKVFHINPSACGLSDLDNKKYIEVNEAFYTLLRFEKGEVIGKTAAELNILPQETREMILSKADVNGRIVNAEADLRAKNGEIKHVLLSSENIFIQDKKYRFTFVNDVTELKKNEADLEYQSKLLLGLSRATDCVLSDEVITKKNITDALFALGVATSVDRVYIFEYIPGEEGTRGFMSQRYEWSLESVGSQIDNPDLQNVNWDEVAPRWYDTFIARNYIFGDVVDFPDNERAILEPQNIVSILVLPIEVENNLWGFIGFDSCKKKREWSASEVRLLRSISNSFAVVIERMRAEEMLTLKTALLESQLNSTLDGILIVDKNQKRILANDRIVEMFNVPMDIMNDKDDTKLLKHVTSQTKEPDKFIEKVKYLYEHDTEVSRDEIEFSNGMVLDRYSAPVLGKNGENYGRIWTFRDITTRK